MRVRSTWKTAANKTAADIYDIDETRKYPPADSWQTGDPDTFGETPVPAEKMSVNSEYEGDSVSRNEIGMGNFRDDTWNHKDSSKWNGPGKYDNARVAAERKAGAAQRIASQLHKSANQGVIDQTAIDLMSLPAKTLSDISSRMHSASVDALPHNLKLRRAYACTKVAYRLAGEYADENQVLTLSRAFMAMDNASLKSVIQTVAKIAASESDEDDADAEDKTASTDDMLDDEKDETKEASSKEEKDEETKEASSKEEACDMTASEEKDDDLVAMFEKTASESDKSVEEEISFEDEDDAPVPPKTASSIKDLFNVKTASGAKKLGNVTKTASTSVNLSDILWGDSY